MAATAAARLCRHYPAMRNEHAYTRTAPGQNQLRFCQDLRHGIQFTVAVTGYGHFQGSAGKEWIYIMVSSDCVLIIDWPRRRGRRKTCTSIVEGMSLKASAKSSPNTFTQLLQIDPTRDWIVSGRDVPDKRQPQQRRLQGVAYGNR